MGRLFWKFFLVTWVTLVLVGATIGTLVWLFTQGSGTAFRNSQGPPTPLLPLGTGMLACLAASALLAFYFAKPIRVLRQAMDTVASGNLSTRVMPGMGDRRDEIADLGRGFDRMTAQLEELLESQRRLLHDVSHELRSPLARLQAAIGLARQNPEKIEKTLSRIEREAARLDDLVEELLALSHIEALDRSPGSRESVDLMELVASISEDARFEAQASGRGLELSMKGEAVRIGWAEPLRRAFENVIRNAVKFTSAGSAVQVNAESREHVFEVTVSDAGPGVNPEELPRIFEPFFRGESASGKSGSGLGLAIARRAVEAHGGSIRAENRGGGGLTVGIRIPL